jgi:hypothetical protein
MRSEMSGRAVETSRRRTSRERFSHPAPTPALPDLPTCESCQLRPASLVWVDDFDQMGFHLCPTCHPDWRDR